MVVVQAPQTRAVGHSGGTAARVECESDAKQCTLFNRMLLLMCVSGGTGRQDKSVSVLQLTDF